MGILDSYEEEARRDRERANEQREEHWLDSGHFVVVIEDYRGDMVPKRRQLVFKAVGLESAYCTVSLRFCPHTARSGAGRT